MCDVMALKRERGHRISLQKVNRKYSMAKENQMTRVNAVFSRCL